MKTLVIGALSVNAISLVVVFSFKKSLATAGLSKGSEISLVMKPSLKASLVIIG